MQIHYLLLLIFSTSSTLSTLTCLLWITLLSFSTWSFLRSLNQLIGCIHPFLSYLLILSTLITLVTPIALTSFLGCTTLRLLRSNRLLVLQRSQEYGSSLAIDLNISGSACLVALGALRGCSTRFTLSLRLSPSTRGGSGSLCSSRCDLPLLEKWSDIDHPFSLPYRILVNYRIFSALPGTFELKYGIVRWNYHPFSCFTRFTWSLSLTAAAHAICRLSEWRPWNWPLSKNSSSFCKEIDVV